MGFDHGAKFMASFLVEATLSEALRHARAEIFAVDVSDILHRLISATAPDILSGNWEPFDGLLRGEPRYRPRYLTLTLND